MTAYRSTEAQRDAVKAMRNTYPQLRTLTAPAVWRIVEAIRADDELDIDTAIATLAAKPTTATVAHAGISTVDEPSAVVEYDAAGFLVALDGASMVARGLSKADTDDLTDAMSVIRAWCDPTGRSFAFAYTSEHLVKQAQLARGAAGKPDLRLTQVQQRVTQLLDDAANDQDRILIDPTTMRRCYPLAVDLEDDAALPPVKLHFVYTQMGSAAQQRGEDVWVIVHQPVYETYTDRQTGEIRTGQSRWASKGSTFSGVARTFKSERDAAAAHDELRSALATYRRITAELAEGDPRYTADPVRTAGIQRDVTPRTPREQAIA